MTIDVIKLGLESSVPGSGDLVVLSVYCIPKGKQVRKCIPSLLHLYHQFFAVVIMTAPSSIVPLLSYCDSVVDHGSGSSTCCPYCSFWSAGAGG
jgi:hypothetical protein